MNNKYFNRKDTIYNITEKYNEAIDLLKSIGIDNIDNQEERESFGKKISLEMALKLKKINIDTFENQLIELIENRNETDENKESKEEVDIKIEGVLPCPVRVPLLDSLKVFLETYDSKLKIGYDLKAASMGVDWLKDSLKNGEDKIADIFISAGFDLFFDKKLFGKYKNLDVFKDITDFDKYNDDFDNEYMSLKDPDKQYSIIGVVPAVFLVNQDELGNRKMPSSWEDLLSKEFENKVSLPIGDFDLFNAILLNIYKKYGEDGVKRLGKSLLKSMHPSEMVKSNRDKGERPIVTIMPYFFTKMTKRGGPMKAIWPEDGAIISPIFLLSKKKKQESLKSLVDFFASKDVGEILSHNGKFPSVNPNVNNMIPKEQKYMWIGWEYIKENDIGSLIKVCESLFEEGMGVEK